MTGRAVYKPLSACQEFGAKAVFENLDSVGYLATAASVSDWLSPG